MKEETHTKDDPMTNEEENINTTTIKITPCVIIVAQPVILSKVISSVNFI